MIQNPLQMLGFALLIVFFTKKIDSCQSLNGCLGTSASPCLLGKYTQFVVELDNTKTKRFYPFCVPFGFFSKLKISEGHTFLNDSKLSTITIHYGNEKTLPRFYWNQASTKLYSVVHNAKETVRLSYLSLIMKVELGYISYSNRTSNSEWYHYKESCSIKIDDNSEDYCAWTGTAECVNSIANRQFDCGISEDRFIGNTTYSNMDFEIFLSWDGTDMLYNKLTSVDAEPQRFKLFAGSITHLYRQFVEFVSNFL